MSLRSQIPRLLALQNSLRIRHHQLRERVTKRLQLQGVPQGGLRINLFQSHPLLDDLSLKVKNTSEDEAKENQNLQNSRMS